MYTGDSENTGYVTPTTDSERVQGQIDRGEVDASADAARQIAAKHEEQYGNVFRPNV